jgi:CRP-like cAMP-binding protein
MTDGHPAQVGWLARSLGRGDLAPFTATDVAALAQSIGVESVRPGTRLMTEGEASPVVSIIQRGSVELYRLGGKRRVVLQVLHAGDVLGDVPLLSEGPPQFSAKALSECDLIRLSGTDLHRFLRDNPAVCHRFLVSLADRLQRMQARLLQVTQGDLSHQVARVLLEETAGTEAVVPLTQGTIAQLLGAARPSVNKVLQSMAKASLVELGYRRIRVLDAKGLSRL